MDKKELRISIQEKRRQLTRDYLERANAEIATRLLLHPVLQQVSSVFTYVSMPDEPDTRTVIEALWQMGKTVAVPRCLPGPERRMEACVIQSWSDLQPGTLGILEPAASCPVIDGYKLELALVPCVTADKSGHRLGHGAGYYDRFLRGLRIYRYCLCYEALLSPEVPTDSLDIPMDLVITESGIHNPRLQSSGTPETSPSASAAQYLQQVRSGLRKLPALLRSMFPHNSK